MATQSSRDDHRDITSGDNVSELQLSRSFVWRKKEKKKSPACHKDTKSAETSPLGETTDAALALTLSFFSRKSRKINEQGPRHGDELRRDPMPPRKHAPAF